LGVEKLKIWSAGFRQLKCPCRITFQRGEIIPLFFICTKKIYKKSWYITFRCIVIKYRKEVENGHTVKNNSRNHQHSYDSQGLARRNEIET